MKELGNVFILGDSYSTFENCIPAKYCNYYSKGNENTYGISSKKQTWWGLLLQKTRSNLVINDSYSGSTVCYTGYSGVDAEKTSFLHRLNVYIENDYFKKIKLDTLLIFGATNDSWANVPLGDFGSEDFYSFLPALKRLIETAKSSLKNVRIIFIINTELKPEIQDAIIEECVTDEIQYILLKNIQKINGHPNKTGMEQIAVQIYEEL